MNIEAFNTDTLRKLVRNLQDENKKLKEKLTEANIPYEKINPFEQAINIVAEYDPDQGGRIIHPEYITENMAKRFFAMFWGREDVYAKRGKNGGYFPQCDNRWNNYLCPKQQKKKVYCDECSNRKWTSLDVKKIITHLLGYKEDGSDVIGVYPLLPDGTCRFLVFDFDNHEKDAEKNDFANQNDEWKDEVDALPLQGLALKNGNSAFVDDNWNAYPDQWGILLNKTKKLSVEEIDMYIEKWKQELIQYQGIAINDNFKDRPKPWKKKQAFSKVDVTGKLHIVLSDGVYVDTLNIMPRLQNQIRSMAAFDNPEFYKNKRMGYSNYYNYSVVYLGKDANGYIQISRGLRESIIDQCKTADIDYDISDERQRKSVIGILHGGKNTLTGIIDVAMVGSMYSKGKYQDMLNSYGMVIMDECHHAASKTSIQLLQKINAKYVYGVSATPKRGDHLDRIIYILLGPQRHKFTALDRAKQQGIGHYFIPRYTRMIETEESKQNINKAYQNISENNARNQMIIEDVKSSIHLGQTPVILTRYKEHAKVLYQMLEDVADNIFLLYGDNTDRQNLEIRESLKQVKKEESLILVATGQKIGEGFDCPRLDTLMLVAPVSFDGRLEQYIGRLNRDYEGKEAVYVYDYVDSHMRFFDNMYIKRLRTYKRTGFTLWIGDFRVKQNINAIYDSGNYSEKFEQDIVEADKSIVISSPDIYQDKIERFLYLIKQRQEAGVNVRVITRNPENIMYGNPEILYELITRMKCQGVDVYLKDEVEERFAVIDDRLVWHGGVNLLGKEDVWDNLMRIKNIEVAAELLEIGFGEKHVKILT